MQNNQTVVAQGMKVVLNGGSSQMEGATIPIQWFFDTKTADMRPTHIVIVDYTKSQFESYSRPNLGRRYIVKVTDTIKFLEFYSAGEHVLCFVALSIPDDRSEESKILRNLMIKKFGEYDVAIGFNGEELAWHKNSGLFSVASLIVSITVPRELFAEVPKAGFRRALWNFVNGSLRGLPDDQCHTRRRFLVILPLKLAFYVPIRIVLGIIRTVLTALVSGVVLFAGWKPSQPWRMLKNVWNFNYPMGEICDDGFWKHSLPQNGYGFRAWKVKYVGWNDYQVLSRMPMAPWQLVFVLMSGYAVYNNWDQIVSGLVIIGHDIVLWAVAAWHGLVAWVMSLKFGNILPFLKKVLIWFSRQYWLLGIPAGFLISRLLHKYGPRLRRFMVEKKVAEKLRLPEFKIWAGARRDKIVLAVDVWLEDQAKKRKVRQYEEAEKLKIGQLDSNQRYTQWLKTDLVATKAPVKVDLRNLPKAFDGKGSISRRVVVGFWALKSKVCKPYARG